LVETPTGDALEVIRTLDEIEGLREAIAGARHFGIDSESNSMFVYRERVCLVQLSIDERLVLIDPCELPRGPTALAALKGLMEDPARSIVLHGGEYDVAVFKREFDISLRGVFDTQQAATFLGWPRTGLGSLVESVCGVKLTKAYAKHDWGKRPIPEPALAYALDDVRYLAALHAHLEAEVAKADLDEEVAIANRAVEGAAAHGSTFNPAGFWRVKGMKELNEHGKRTLQSLYLWREKMAEALDRPPGRLLNNQAMVALARRPPKDESELRRTRLPPVIKRKHGRSLLHALSKSTETELLPRPLRREVPSKAVDKREKRLKDWRRKEAEARGVPLTVVLPGRALSWLAEDPSRDWTEAPQFGAKRMNKYAEQLRELLGAEASRGSD
jgi:ribonuclease D